MFVVTRQENFGWEGGYGSAFAIYQLDERDNIIDIKGWLQIVDGEWRYYNNLGWYKEDRINNFLGRFLLEKIDYESGTGLTGTGRLTSLWPYYIEPRGGIRIDLGLENRMLRYPKETADPPVFFSRVDEEVFAPLTLTDPKVWIALLKGEGEPARLEAFPALLPVPLANPTKRRLVRYFPTPSERDKIMLIYLGNSIWYPTINLMEGSGSIFHKRPTFYVPEIEEVVDEIRNRIKKHEDFIDLIDFWRELGLEDPTKREHRCWDYFINFCRTLENEPIVIEHSKINKFYKTVKNWFDYKYQKYKEKEEEEKEEELNLQSFGLSL